MLWEYHSSSSVLFACNLDKGAPLHPALAGVCSQKVGRVHLSWFVTASLRHILHIIKFPHFISTTQWFLVNFYSFTTLPYFSIHIKLLFYFLWTKSREKNYSISHICIYKFIIIYMDILYVKTLRLT